VLTGYVTDHIGFSTISHNLHRRTLFLPSFILRMPSQLCHACSQVPVEFFSEEHDDKWFHRGPEVRLQPVNSMLQATSLGCPLCAILTKRVSGLDWLPLHVLEGVPVSLRRAIIDTHQGVCLCIGIDDLSHSTFFCVPSSWSKRKLYLPSFKNKSG
jgi:hypothetical protein